MTNEQFEKLPLYARQEITRLRNELSSVQGHKKTLLGQQVRFGERGIYQPYFAVDDSKMELQNRPVYFGDEKSYVAVKLTERGVEIRGQRGLTISPLAGNVVEAWNDDN